MINSPLRNNKRTFRGLPFIIVHHDFTVLVGFIFLFLAFSMMIFTLLFTELSLIFFIILISVFLGLSGLLLNAGPVGQEFLHILDNISAQNIKFDAFRLTMEFHYCNTRVFIRYHALYSPYTMVKYLINYFPAHEGIVEHYQIWMKISEGYSIFESVNELAKKLRAHGIMGYLFPIQPQPPENPFSPQVLPYISPNKEKIPSLIYVDLARRNKESIVVAFLRKDASPPDIKNTIEMLQTIPQKVLDNP